MHNALPRSRSTPTLDSGFDAVLASARLLQVAANAAETPGLLRGKNLGLLCESEEDDDAVLFRSAATGLGASVSHIRAQTSGRGMTAGAALLETARLLGRLYDGIECQGLPPALVRQLNRDAGVPVFDGVARASHPTAQLAQRLGGTDSLAKKRQLVVQAVLLCALR